MTSGYPDWTRAIMLLGVDPNGDLIGIGTDGDGYLIVPIKGLNPSDELATVRVDANGQLYVILRGASGNDVAVDASGFISAILKGQGATGLVSVAVDDNGYLQAYVLDDESQWGDIIRVGNAELAARLGSPVTWDWRGQVVAAYDFAHGYHGGTSALVGTGAAIALDPTYWQHGGYSVKLTAGSTSSKYAALTFGLGLPPATRIGVAMSFAVGTVPYTLDIRCALVKSEESHQPKIRYNFTDDKLQYENDQATWSDVATQKVLEVNYCFQQLKMVFDLDDETYERVILNDTEHSMTANYNKVSASGIGNYFLFGIYCTEDGSDNPVAYIDNVVVTVQEP